MRIKTRVKLFNVALAWAGITLKDFAEEIGVSRHMVWYVLWGRRKSKRVMAEVDSFIDKELGDLFKKVLVPEFGNENGILSK